MTTTHQKLQILQTLNQLDAVQSEIVLRFIKGLVQEETVPPARQYFKRRAMKEIGQALRQGENSF